VLQAEDTRRPDEQNEGRRPTTNRASRKFETKGLGAATDSTAVLARSLLLNSLLVRSANPSEEQLRRLSIILKKFCTCTARTSPSPDRLGSVRGDGLPGGREKLHAPGGTNQSTKRI
jgi:hypothetical protein